MDKEPHWAVHKKEYKIGKKRWPTSLIIKEMQI